MIILYCVNKDNRITCTCMKLMLLCFMLQHCKKHEIPVAYTMIFRLLVIAKRRVSLIMHLVCIVTVISISVIEDDQKLTRISA